MNSIKLCVTSQTNLDAKYNAAGSKAIRAAVRKWISADARRGIHTLYIAIDDPASMSPHGVPALTGAVTALKAKRVIDQLWKKLQPDYLAIFGAQDVIPYFEVPNPSLSKDDTDATIPTDNPYACDKAFNRRDVSSYLVPGRVCGRIPDMPENGDPAWFVHYLRRATEYKSQPASFFADPYAICCEAWKGAGRKTMQHIGADPARLLLSPPADDRKAAAQARLARRLHLIKCHGAELDPRFFGQRGEDFPTSLESRTLKKKLLDKTLAAAMCCYGAQLYSPTDPRATLQGEWPLASTYLRNGALGFAGSTMIAWVGLQDMMCADWIAAGFLKAALGGASLGRAFLDSKLGYLQWLDQQGQTPDVADEKTMVEFVLLGDPSVHPVLTAALPAITLRAAAALASSPLAASERRQRRAVRVRLAETMGRELPTRSTMQVTHSAPLRRLLAQAEQLAAAQGDRIPFGNATPVTQKVARPPRRLPAGIAAARAPAARTASTSYQYYWTDRTNAGGIQRIRLIKLETDMEGMLIRSRVVHSS